MKNARELKTVKQQKRDTKEQFLHDWCLDIETEDTESYRFFGDTANQEDVSQEEIIDYWETNKSKLLKEYRKMYPEKDEFPNIYWKTLPSASEN